MYYFYHNPRCSKSRTALEYLQSHGISLEVIEYLKTPPTKARLQKLLAKLTTAKMEIIRSGEVLFKTLGIAKNLSDSEIIDILLKYPVLLQRPILETEDKVAIGRPLERMIEIL